MLRLTIILCAGLFTALLIGGEDRGQKRFGLLEAEAEAKAAADRVVVEQAAPPPTEPLRAEAPAQTITVAFGTQQPLRAAPASPETGAAPEPAPATTIETVLTEEPPLQVMYVTGRAVNVRSGPSTGTDVVGRLTRGEAVTVIGIEEDGWARIRIEGDGIDGFMSMDFLTDIAG